MKRILIALIVALTFCSLSWAQSQTARSNDESGKSTTTTSNSHSEGVVEGSDSTYVADSIALAEDSMENQFTSLTAPDKEEFPFHFYSGSGSEILVAIIAIIAIFGLPVFVIFIVFYFRYKNRRARYRIAEQALAAGHPLPDNFFKENKLNDSASQGIRNTFTGIGLFIFLWAITGEFRIGSIGLLVMFMGIGQWLIGFSQQRKNKAQDFGKDKYEEE